MTGGQIRLSRASSSAAPRSIPVTGRGCAQLRDSRPAEMAAFQQDTTARLNGDAKSANATSEDSLSTDTCTKASTQFVRRLQSGAGVR